MSHMHGHHRHHDATHMPTASTPPGRRRKARCAWCRGIPFRYPDVSLWQPRILGGNPTNYSDDMGVAIGKEPHACARKATHALRLIRSVFFLIRSAFSKCMWPSHNESGLRYRVYRCVLKGQEVEVPQRCLRPGAVTTLMLAVQCKYQRIQGLSKW